MSNMSFPTAPLQPTQTAPKAGCIHGFSYSVPPAFYSVPPSHLRNAVQGTVAYETCTCMLLRASEPYMHDLLCCFSQKQLCRLDVVAAFLREVENLERRVRRDGKSVLRGRDFQPQQRLYLCDNLAQILSYRMTQVSQSIFISIPE